MNRRHGNSQPGKSQPANSRLADSRPVRFAGIALILAISSLVASPSVAKSTPYIVNGRPTTIGVRPYQVAVLNMPRGDTNYKRLYCGGSVVAPTIVITAGHCTFDSITPPSQGMPGSAVPTSPSDLRVLVNTASLLSGGQSIAVTSIVRHPNYHPEIDETLNDVALLRLATPVTAAPIAIIPPQSDYRITLPGAVGTVSGWGCFDTAAQCGLLSDYPTGLRIAALALHSNPYCTSIYARFHVNFDGVKSLCAGDPSASATAPGPCFGDSGGPLTVPGIGGHDLLIGLVSWGVVCGGTPTAFTRITTYRSWLESHGVPVAPAPFGATTGPLMHAGAHPIAGDFDGDGHSDVLAYVKGATPDVIYRGDASRHLHAGESTTINGGYEPIVCDTNHDTKQDLILYGPGVLPDSALFGADQPGSFTHAPILTINGSYKPLSGDFNHDGVCDILFYGPGAFPDELVLGDGTGHFVPAPVSQVNGIYAPFVGDFNGDGFDDIYWYSPSGHSSEWVAGPGGFHSTVPPSPGPGFTPVAGDFDGNGRTDILWYGLGATPDALWNSTSTGFHRINDIAINGIYATAVGDIDGDGKDEIVWYSSNGTTSIWRYLL